MISNISKKAGNHDGQSICFDDILLYTHNHNHNDISIQRHMYKFKYREIHNFLTGELTVVQVRTFISFLTSEFCSSTREERDTILKSLS